MAAPTQKRTTGSTKRKGAVFFIDDVQVRNEQHQPAMKKTKAEKKREDAALEEEKMALKTGSMASLFVQPVAPRARPYGDNFPYTLAQLAHRWSTGETATTLVLQGAARDVCIWNNGEQAGFGVAFEQAWDACRLARITYGGRGRGDSLVLSCRGVLSALETKEKRTTVEEPGRVDYVEVFHIETTEQTTRYRMRMCEFEAVLACMVLSPDIDWCGTVQRHRQVPSALLRGLLALRIPLCNVFPSLKGGEEAEVTKSLPRWLNLCVNVPRALHHAQPGGLLSQLRSALDDASGSTSLPWETTREEEEKDDDTRHGSDDDEEDDMDRFSDCSSSERSAFYVAATAAVTAPNATSSGQERTLEYKERSLDMLQEHGCELKFRMYKTREGAEAYLSGPQAVSDMHPYTLSSLAFAVATRACALLLERQGARVAEAWTAPRIYQFFLRWLRMDDHVVAAGLPNNNGGSTQEEPAKVPDVVLTHASLLLSLLEQMVSEQLMRAAEQESTRTRQLSHFLQQKEGEEARDLLGHGTAHAQPVAPVARTSLPPCMLQPHPDKLLREDALAVLRQWCPHVRDMARLHFQREHGQGHFVSFRHFGDVSQYAEPMAPPAAASRGQQPRLLDQYERDRRRVARRLCTEFFLSAAELKGKQVLLLDRSRVHPLSVARSLQILERWFYPKRAASSSHANATGFAAWRIFHDRHQIYVLANSEQELFELSRFCVPYVAAPGSAFRFSRLLPYPLYVHQLHAFFYGGAKGRLLAVKWMLRTFCGHLSRGDVTGCARQKMLSSERGASLMPSDEEDPVVDFYRLLPLLLDRCLGSAEELWQQLRQPWRNLQFLSLRSGRRRNKTSKKDKKAPGRIVNIRGAVCARGPTSKAKFVPTPSGVAIDHGPAFGDPDIDPEGSPVVDGLADDAYTLYHALRAFSLPYAAHSISRYAFEALYAYFLHNGRLQHELPLAFRLLSHMQGNETRFDMELDEARHVSGSLPEGTQAANQWRSAVPPATRFGWVDDQDPDMAGAALPIPSLFFTPQEFPFPAHLVLYHACVHPDVPRDLASLVFFGVSCSTRGRMRDQWKQFSLAFPRSSPWLPASPLHASIFRKQVDSRVREASEFLAEDRAWALKVLQGDAGAIAREAPPCAAALQALFHGLEEACVLYRHKVHAADLCSKQDKAADYRGHAPEIPSVFTTLDEHLLLLTPQRPLAFPVDWDPQDELSPHWGADELGTHGVPMYSDRVLPIWPSGLVELAEWPGNFENAQRRRDGSKLLTHGTCSAVGQIDRMRFLSYSLDARPFADAHPDLLNCVLLNPVREIVVSESQVTAPDLDAVPSSLAASTLPGVSREEAIVDAMLEQQAQSAASAGASGKSAVASLGFRSWLGSTMERWVEECPPQDPRFFQVLGSNPPMPPSPGASPEQESPMGSPTSPLDARIERLRRATYEHASEAMRKKQHVSVARVLSQVFYHRGACPTGGSTSK